MNWVHVDFKGTAPQIGEMEKFIRFWKKCGYDGLILEFDDRLPWRTWPGTWRRGYTDEELDLMLKMCRDNGLQVAPLIQIQGHLEWLLKHPQYAYLRENNVGNELCPLHEESMPLLKKWLAEIRERFPESEYVHLGADETWNLGTCEKCRKQDKMRIYTDHVSELCRQASAAGMTPMIWADMFWREKRPELAELLPDETILVDWQYEGVPPYPTMELLSKTGHTLAGASAALRSYWEHSYRIMTPQQSQVENCAGWYKYAKEHDMPVIVTTWGRPASTWELSSPWYAGVPAYIAGADPERWASHPWCSFIEKVAGVMVQNHFPELRKAAEEAEKLPAADELEEGARDFIVLALEHQAMQQEYNIAYYAKLSLDRVSKYVGKTEPTYSKNTTLALKKMLVEFDRWEEKARAYWKKYALQDEDEYIETHLDIFRSECLRMLSAE